MEKNKIWQGNWTFIMAAAGSAVGLGKHLENFPYMTGNKMAEGAFVFNLSSMYLAYRPPCK